MGAMRSLVSFLGGAVSVGLVVGVLAASGVIDDDTSTVATTTEAPSPPATAPSAAKPVNTQPTNISEIYKRVSPGVAFVQSSGGGQAATGSGFVYDAQGHIVTNDHVVEGFNSFSVRVGSDQTPIRAQL